MRNNGYKAGRGMAGYSYEAAKAAIEYYRDKLFRKVNYAPLPVELAQEIIRDKKPECPYCGAGMKAVRSMRTAMWYTQCVKCSSTGPMAVNEDVAIMMAIR